MVISYYGSITDPDLWKIMKFLDENQIAVNKSISDLPDKVNFEILSKLTLSEYVLKSNQIRADIARKRQDYELIVVEPKTASTASFAARDNRVDIIRINPKVGLSIYNKRYGNRVIDNNKLIEIDLSFFFQRHIASTLRRLMRILETFSPLNLQYHLTNTPTSPFHLRSYRGLQSLGRLIGLPNKQTSPKYIINRVKRNRKKLNGKIPFPGVELHGSKD